MWSGEAMSRSEACGRAYSSGPFLGTDGGGGPAGDAHEELKENRWNGTEREYPENGNAGGFRAESAEKPGFFDRFFGGDRVLWVIIAILSVASLLVIFSVDGVDGLP